VFLIKLLELLRKQQLSIAQQFGASALTNWVRWTMSVFHIIRSFWLSVSVAARFIVV